MGPKREFERPSHPSAFLSSDGTSAADIASDVAVGAACTAVAIPPVVCVAGKHVIVSLVNKLGKSGASTGNADLDKQLCGTKPGPFASGSKWKTYHDCLMNKGAALKASFNNALRAASNMPPQQSPADLIASPSDISGTWLDSSGNAIHIDGAKIMDHPEGSFDTTFKPGTMSLMVPSRSGWGTATISADGKTLTWPSGNWVKTANSTNSKGSPDGSGKPASATWGVKQWGLYIGLPAAALTALFAGIYYYKTYRG